ncbi:beta-lactamase [Cohnella kolymensis]|uniref:Beta-lactamase n=1 Tax=Cohnella kolymensis TaxID=1590652 RepID=A0ABR5A129_9BACL|nr:MBL fold metallo-hydrolase [Cohnella kolymensis]KIL34740.1 beta-lactamase [Cohnella kolymensis]
MRIKFLGNGDSMGTPRVYCDCPVCGEARTTGANRRMRSSLLLRTEAARPLLLDCGPDFRAQMEAAGLRHVSHGLLTHAHMDHIGGLTDWADGCRWRKETAEVFAPSEVLTDVRDRFPWIENHLRLLANDDGTQYGDWRVRPWKVNHGKNGYSYAYRFDNTLNGKAWAYCSDSIDLTEHQKAPLSGLALLVLGTSFVREPFPMETRSVYDMEEGLQLAAEVKPHSVIFTHLSHDVDVNSDYGLPPNVTLAATGMEITI